MTREVEDILAEVKAGRRMTAAEAVELLQVKGRDIYQVIAAAEEVKREQVSDQVTYVINYNLNLSNICLNNCLFCGFNESLDSPAAYRLDFKEIKEHLDQAKKEEVSEICLVSGLHPDFDLNTYLEIIEEIKAYLPKVHLHGITPAELEHALRNKELSLQEGYALLQEAGLDSVPGTAAEILVPQVREKICPDKISADQWIEAIKAAHQLGLRSTATILYGHLETTAERVEHLRIIRDLQDETGGFTEFIPLSFIPYETPLGHQGQVREETTGREDLLMIAVSRLFLDNITNLQASWVKYGPKLAQLMLTAGANDLGGTLFNENISQAAGRETAEYLAPERMRDLISDMGYRPQERSTLYDIKG